MDSPSECKSFLAAIWRKWIAVMSGAGSLLIALYLQVTNTSQIPAGAFWIIGGVLLFVACYLAWKDEYRKVLALERSLAEATTANLPKLHGEIVSVVHYLSKEVLPHSAFAIQMEITNSGSASIAHKVGVSIVSKDGRTINGFVRTASTKGIALGGIEGWAGQARYSEEDFFEQRAELKAISSGHKTRGVMLVDFFDVDFGREGLTQWSFQVDFRDVVDQEYRLLYPFASEVGRLRILLGAIVA
jgi:hypothetical protein